MTTTVLLVGVGGQGTILAADILAHVALDEGMDAKVSEIHGMSQRAGSVSTVVRFGEEVHSMIADRANTDIIVSFEVIEALRYLDYLKPDGLLITTDTEVIPATVLNHTAEMPKDAKDIISSVHGCIVPAADLSLQAGNSKAANVVLLGALSTYLPFDEQTWLNVVTMRVPPKYIDANIEAFRLGRSFATNN